MGRLPTQFPGAYHPACRPAANIPCQAERPALQAAFLEEDLMSYGANSDAGGRSAVSSSD